MSFKDEFMGLLALGDVEQESAFGKVITVSGVTCKGVIAPLESWYELKTGAGLVRKVNTSCRVAKSYFSKEPLSGSRLIVEPCGSNEEYRVERVRSYDGDPCYVIELSRVAVRVPKR